MINSARNSKHEKADENRKKKKSRSSGENDKTDFKLEWQKLKHWI